MPQPPERRLLTIFAADVSGYSGLMERDEDGTLERLRTYREAMQGLIGRHGGRVANTAGDSVLATFPSVVGAVECAAEIQRELGARNRQLPGAHRMHFRIGINLGDVMVEPDGDVYGDGVNVAARLQALAEPGGICIAGTVHDLVHNKLQIGFDYLGTREVKNIQAQVPVWRVLLNRPSPPDQPREAKAGPQDPTRASRRGFYRYAARAGVLVFALMLIDLITDGGIEWFYYPAVVILAFVLLRAVNLFWI